MKSQQGSTLVMVLIVLLLITLIGTMAMRESLMNLRLSTGVQISNLLLNNSDAGLFELEDPKKISVRLTAQNMYGYFDDDTNADDELVFCYKASKSTFFNLRDTSVIGKNGKRGTRGYCTSSTFATGRSAVLSQVYLRKLSSSNSGSSGSSGNALDSQVTDNDIGSKDTTSTFRRIGATVVSVLPSFTNVLTSKVEDCFKLSAVRTNTSDKTNNVEMCFQEYNIPYNIQYSEYNIGSQPTNVNVN